MKLSVIWKLSEQINENTKTLECLKQQSEMIGNKVQLLIYGTKENAEKWNQEIAGVLEESAVCLDEGWKDCEIYQNASKLITGDYVTYLKSGDVWSEHTLERVRQVVTERKDCSIIMLQKIMPDGSNGAFAGGIYTGDIVVKNVWEQYDCYPFYLGGTFLKADLLKNHQFRPELGLETEREFFLTLCAKEKKIFYLPNNSYYSTEAREGDFTFYEGIYEKEWYKESFTEFWLPFLEKMQKQYGKVPEFIQYHLMFTIRSRIESNKDNRNKHVIPEGEEYACLELIGRGLQYVEDNIMFNNRKILECNVVDSLKWVYGILKYGQDYCFEKYYLAGFPYYGAAKTVFNKIENLKINIAFMNYRDGMLEIDGGVHAILFSMASEVYFKFNNKKYELVYNDRYALTKVFGVSIYKSHSFHVSIPIDGIENGNLQCCAKVDNELINILFSYESHFSRISRNYKNGYWCFGKQKEYMMTKNLSGLCIKKIQSKDRRRQERKLQREMFFSFKKKDWLYLGLRKAYFLAKPIAKRKKIWMYIDKIYKGGDSSEYLYRYASKQKENIKHYYLIDKKSTDYKRLKKDGFKPLIRGSMKHRLVFLLADMMVISNSTVFAFNNYGLGNSSYIRDLVDFHVCCVQHGMSVQKIAVAQNRLRDNIRLYFCASKYEIENLSKPIYDYVGYDALKMTGVPRYDGLINDDKKQILISPTWRMQAAVPVRTNEGEQRDYNPLFKESTYYKVFNSLINDERLIQAAKKYGYKIKYVLHPIVSAQVDDFDKNEYVDIIPAVGDMSYERMFCESSLMVTDFSGIQFDFAYMRKPLVYLHHKDIPQHYEEGTFFYDTMGFGEICHDNDELIDLLCEYMKNDCKMKETYIKRADDFFYYDDHNNCKRIYDCMLEYQDKYVN